VLIFFFVYRIAQNQPVCCACGGPCVALFACACACGVARSYFVVDERARPHRCAAAGVVARHCFRGVRVRALRSYLWLKLYEVSQCTRSTRIPMRAPDAFQPARDPGAPQPSVISMPQPNAAPSGFRLLDDPRARPLLPGCQVGTQASLSSEIYMVSISMGSTWDSSLTP